MTRAEEIERVVTELANSSQSEATSRLRQMAKLALRMEDLREIDQLRAALAPFAAVAESDIGQDETDTDIFQPVRSGFNRAPLITVGDMRRALAVTSQTHNTEAT